MRDSTIGDLSLSFIPYHRLYQYTNFNTRRSVEIKLDIYINTNDTRDDMICATYHLVYIICPTNIPINISIFSIISIYEKCNLFSGHNNFRNKINYCITS